MLKELNEVLFVWPAEQMRHQTILGALESSVSSIT
jgi:hypothetical protein